jgi:hypothetical protein
MPVVDQFGFNSAALLGLKHKILRCYSQAEDNACSFTDLRMTNFSSEFDLRTDPLPKRHSPQRHAGSFKDFGYRGAANAIDDEAFFVEAIFAEKQFGKAVAVYVNGVN